MLAAILKIRVTSAFQMSAIPLILNISVWVFFLQIDNNGPYMQ